MTRPTLAIALALTALALLGAPTAQATHVQCGDVVTQDTTLDSDLLNCPGDGVVIGADGITLDLNGHLIDGTGFPDPDAGVDNLAGHDGVTVIGGRIREYTWGVLLRNTSDNLITRLNTETLSLVSGDGDSDRNVISRNTGRGIGFIADADATLIERNVLITDFGTAVSFVGADAKGPVEATGNRVERNTISAPFTGIRISGMFDTVVERNTVSDALSGFGMVVTGVRGRVLHNIVSNSGVGISLGQATDTQLVQNDVVDSTGDGIFVPATVAHNTLLDRNMANRNGDDGIDVESPSTTLTKNTANDNADLGIEAVPGVTDGGGNKVRGNGNPAQCVNVSCK
jgi:parallel beta-helix repeat protein